MALRQGPATLNVSHVLGIFASRLALQPSVVSVSSFLCFDFNIMRQSHGLFAIAKLVVCNSIHPIVHGLLPLLSNTRDTDSQSATKWREFESALSTGEVPYYTSP